MAPDRDPSADPAPPWLPPAGPARPLLALVLCLGALAGNYFNLPLFFGSAFLFGSVASLLAIAWLGTSAGLLAALVGGAYTWLLFDHPYALLAFLAEAGAVAWHRHHALKRGRPAPPLAVSVALYWLLLGIPLGLLIYPAGHGIDIQATLMIVLKQAVNGILNAALAGLILIAVAAIARRRAALPFAELLFGVLLAGMLLPSVLGAAWENRDLKARLEAALADRLRIFGTLSLHHLEAALDAHGDDSGSLETDLSALTQALALILPRAYDPQVRLARDPLLAAGGRSPRAAGAPGRPSPGEALPSAAAGLHLIAPQGPSPSRMALWQQGRYRLVLPAELGLPGERLVMDVAAAPLVAEVRQAVAKLLGALLAVALAGVAAAAVLSRRLVAPIERLAETARTLPAAIRDDRPWSPPPSGVLAETARLAESVTEMAESLAGSFRALRAEKDEQARQRALLDFQAQTLASLVAGGDDESRFALGLCRRVESALPGWRCRLSQTGAQGEHPPDLDPSPTAEPGPDRSSLAPILGRDRAGLGTLRLDRPASGASDPLAPDLLATAAALAGLALESIRLRRRHEVLVDALSQAGTGIAVAELGAEGWRLTYVNRGLTALSGYRAEELLGQGCLFLQGDDPEGPDGNRVRASIDAGQPYRAVLASRRRDGSELWSELALSPMRDAAGQVTHYLALQQDVTESVELLERLRRSESGLKEAQSIAGLGSWDLDMASGELLWSDESYRLLGYRPGAVTPSLETFYAAVPEAERGPIREAMEAARLGRGVFHIEHRVLGPDGVARVLLQQGRMTFDAEGRPLRFAGTSLDVTERRRAEDALRAQEERYRLVVENLEDPIVRVDLKGRIELASPSYCRIFGIAESDPVGRVHQPQIHPEDRAAGFAARECLLRPPHTCILEQRTRTALGWRWLQWSNRAVLDGAGRPVGFVGVGRDVTARKESEQALKDSEQRFRSLFETMGEGVVYLNGAGIVTDANPAALRLLGLELSEIGGRGALDPRWGILGEDGNPLPGEELPPMVALRTGRDSRPTVLGVPNATTGAIAWLLVQAHPELGPGELKPHRVFATLSDITRLKETEYRLAAIIESSPHGIVQADPQTGRPFWYNGAMQRLFGYAGLPMDDLTLADLHPPESLSLVEAELARIAAGDLAPSRDLPCRRRDGSLFYCTLSPGLTRLGQESRLTAFYTDTTERYLAEERVKESEARLSAVFDHAPIGMALVGPERRLALANRALGTFLGRLPESLVGLAFDALCHPGDLDRDLEQTAELLAGRIGSYRMTKRFLRPDGDLVWGDLRTVLLPTRPGEPPIPLKMVEDITELHAATERQQVLEEALTRYTSELEELVDIVNLSLPPVQQIAALLRLGAQALGLAAASLALVGERGEGLMPVAAHWEGIGFAEPEPPAPLLAEALANPGVPCVLGAEGMRESVLGLGLGSCVTLVFESPLPDGRASTLAMTLWGVERSFALGGAERQMLRLIAQRIGAVRFQERMQLDLVESRERETIGHLASGVAHDFNNLLGVIDANIYFLGSSLAELARSDPEIGQVMEETRSALGQAKVITSGMLSLSRAGGVPRGPVDLRALVGELEGILRHVLPPAVALFTAIPPGLKVLSNGAFLQSALLNLALNARDAMPEGGTIEIEAAPLRPDWTVPLAVGKLPEGHCVALSVTDTGTGIEPAILARIFDPLFSTKAKRRGHGLGLFMVQEFVARSGAGLAVESAPGAGTRFRLLLPLAERSASEGSGRGGPGAGDSPAPRTAAAPLAGLRILVVDDDPRVRDAVSRLLAIEGASLGSAEGGQAGLDLLGRDPGFDLVLSDIAMPGLDGFALLRRLADLRPELPVLLMTGQERSPGAAEGLPEGTPVLRKPIDPQALRESVLTAIAARQPGRAG